MNVRFVVFVFEMRFNLCFGTCDATAPAAVRVEALPTVALQASREWLTTPPGGKQSLCLVNSTLLATDRIPRKTIDLSCPTAQLYRVSKCRSACWCGNQSSKVGGKRVGTYRLFPRNDVDDALTAVPGLSIVSPLSTGLCPPTLPEVLLLLNRTWSPSSIVHFSKSTLLWRAMMRRL